MAAKSRPGIAFVCCVLAAAPLAAHHSFAMFDDSKTMTLEGTVSEFQWSNPHIWIQLMVPEAAGGKQTEWSIEGASPNGLMRQGWSRHSVKPGDKAVVVMHPLKEGGHGGTLLSLTINGQRIGRAPAP